MDAMLTQVVRDRIVDTVLTLSDIQRLGVSREDGYVLMGGVKPASLTKEQAYPFHSIVRRVWHAVFGGERGVTRFIVRGKDAVEIRPDESISDPLMRAAVLVDEAMAAGTSAGVALAAAGQLCLASGIPWPVASGDETVRAFRQAVEMPAGVARMQALLMLFRSAAS